jgi:hypothetical protein
MENKFKVGDKVERYWKRGLIGVIVDVEQKHIFGRGLVSLYLVEFSFCTSAHYEAELEKVTEVESNGS